MQAAKGAEAWWRLRPKALHQSVLLQDKWLQQVTQHQPRTGNGLENVWPGQVFLSVESRQVRHLLAPRPKFFVIERVLGLECVLFPQDFEEFSGRRPGCKKDHLCLYATCHIAWVKLDSILEAARIH